MVFTYEFQKSVTYVDQPIETPCFYYRNKLTEDKQIIFSIMCKLILIRNTGTKGKLEMQKSSVHLKFDMFSFESVVYYENDNLNGTVWF
jgi:hypothetical protein